MTHLAETAFINGKKITGLISLLELTGEIGKLVPPANIFCYMVHVHACALCILHCA